MKRYYKVIAGYECGGPEDGMMCRCGEWIYEAESEKEAVRICDEENSNNEYYLGCRADLATDEEIKEFIEWESMELPF